MSKGAANELDIIKKAENLYSEMTALVSNHAEGQMREDWFVEAKQEVDDLLSKLAELDEASLTPEEREYRAFSKPKVDEAKSRFEEDQSVNRHQFV